MQRQEEMRNEQKENENLMAFETLVIVAPKAQPHFLFWGSERKPTLLNNYPFSLKLTKLAPFHLKSRNPNYACGDQYTFQITGERPGLTNKRWVGSLISHLKKLSSMSHLHKNKFHDLDIIRKNLTMEYRKKKC